MGTTATERGTLVITVAASTVAFSFGFNLGAFNVVFFDAVLSIWVTSTIVLLGSLITDLPPQHWWGRLILLIPTAWLVLAWISDPAGSDRASQALFTITVIVTVVCLPFIAWILVSVINPDFLDLPRASRVAVISAVLVFGLSGFGIGARNDLFLNCDDFKVSGNDLPVNCTPVPPRSEQGD